MSMIENPFKAETDAAAIRSGEVEPKKMVISLTGSSSVVPPSTKGTAPEFDIFGTGLNDYR
ncbi:MULTISPECIES: hypothetical protein [Bacillus]|jgi:hypothetical protein|nr:MULTISPECIES: hypothetical protein [Bacillus]MCR6611135.1 hypothetical protein [Bacillus infantis]PLR74708.1 hypothetical protein CYJ37_03555 [Bacillus sp. UMB0728]